MSVASSERIREASDNVAPMFLHTPQYRLEVLANKLGIRLVCKLETANTIRSFKGRGVDWWMRQRRPAAVVCATAGNLGQAVAYGCRERDIPAHLFVRRQANVRKVRAMAELGARIHEAGDDFDEAKLAARAFSDRNQFPFLDDGNDLEVAEGFGTIALELCEEFKLDVLYVPVGSGALAHGCGAWCCANTRAKVIGVCAEGAPAMHHSIGAGCPQSTDSTNTIADGVAVRHPTTASVSALANVLDSIVLVDDAEVKGAMQRLFREERIVSEPSGAVALAGLLSNADRHRGQQVAVVVTGANPADDEARWLLESA